MPTIKIINFTNKEIITKKTLGLNIYSAYDYEIPPGDHIGVKTDLQIKIPFYYYINIIKNDYLSQSLFITQNLIETKGPLIIYFLNVGKTNIFIKKNSCIGKFILQKKILFDIVQDQKEICMNWNNGYCQDICPNNRRHNCHICYENHQKIHHEGDFLKYYFSILIYYF